MTIEERELYCYVTGSEPFASVIKSGNRLKTIIEIVTVAAAQYCKTYCTEGEECFSDKDIDNVSVQIYQENENKLEEKERTCKGCKHFNVCGDLERYEKCDGYDKRQIWFYRKD